MSIDVSRFHATFFEESLEGLDAMEAALLSMESGGDSDPETINTIFRAAHSIKGGSATFGFAEIAGVTHLLETLLDQMRAGDREVTPPAVDLLLQSVDVLRSMMDTAQNGGDYDQARIDELLQNLKQMLEAEAESEQPSASGAADEGGQPAGWNIRFAPLEHMFRTGNDPLRILRELAALGEAEPEASLERLPALKELDPSTAYLTWIIELLGDASREDVDEVFAWVEDDCELGIEPIIRELLDDSGPSPAAGEAAGPSESAEPIEPAAEAPAEADKVVDIRPPAASPPAAAQAAKPPAKRSEGGSIRVATEKVDALINLVGELVITQAMVAQGTEQLDPVAYEKLLASVEELERNTRDLQEAVLSVRMMPMEFAFQRFPRLVRDLAGKLNKKIDLQTSGEATELDKSVIEKIVDPLNHIVRNSIDHGIEMPADRVAAGKPETGSLQLSAMHEGGNIVIRIKDDGRGMARDKILASAAKRGVPVSDDMTDSEVFQLIFTPGLSTAAEVTDISGRGVGMDVVKKNIIHLGGSVDIQSTVGVGTTITIRLPLTLAILDGMLVNIGTETFVIPLNFVVESLRIQDASVKTVSGSERLLKVRSEYIPIVNLRSQFNVSSVGADQGLVVVVEAEGQKLALEVDELVGQQQVVIKNLEANYRKVDCVSGATILGDGRVALIVDVGGLQRDARQAA